MERVFFQYGQELHGWHGKSKRSVKKETNSHTQGGTDSRRPYRESGRKKFHPLEWSSHEIGREKFKRHVYLYYIKGHFQVGAPNPIYIYMYNYHTLKINKFYEKKKKKNYS